MKRRIDVCNLCGVPFKVGDVVAFAFDGDNGPTPGLNLMLICSKCAQEAEQ